MVWNSSFSCHFSHPAVACTGYFLLCTLNEEAEYKRGAPGRKWTHAHGQVKMAAHGGRN